jgi:hypothetical protein
MLKRSLASLLVATSLGLFIGCTSGGSSDSSSSSSSSTTQAAASQPAIPIPPDSPFARVKMGEDLQQVYADIGRPTSEYSYITGKSFIPFHFSGSDNHRMDAHYKGMGVITFSNDSAYSSGMSVEEIDYNPKETGFNGGN